MGRKISLNSQDSEKVNVKNSILIIDDEPSITDNIEYALKTEGFEAVSAHTGQRGLEELDAGDFSLVILDVGLPDFNGFELCGKIRRISDAPIIFLTARDAEIDRIVGLEIGGDDYVTKPFSPRELTARVRAILRRCGKRVESPKEESKNSLFYLDVPKRSILYHGRKLSLSHYEYEILKIMIENPKKVFSRKELMSSIWDTPEMSMDRTVDTHIKTIRSKLSEINPKLSPIITHRGFGYSLIT